MDIPSNHLIRFHFSFSVIARYEAILRTLDCFSRLLGKSNLLFRSLSPPLPIVPSPLLFSSFLVNPIRGVYDKVTLLVFLVVLVSIVIQLSNLCAIVLKSYTESHRGNFVVHPIRAIRNNSCNSYSCNLYSCNSSQFV